MVNALVSSYYTFLNIAMFVELEPKSCNVKFHTMVNLLMTLIML